LFLDFLFYSTLVDNIFIEKTENFIYLALEKRFHFTFGAWFSTQYGYNPRKKDTLVGEEGYLGNNIYILWSINTPGTIEEEERGVVYLSIAKYFHARFPYSHVVNGLGKRDSLGGGGCLRRLGLPCNIYVDA
jgi:hypothetical protein